MAEPEHAEREEQDSGRAGEAGAQPEPIQHRKAFTRRPTDGSARKEDCGESRQRSEPECRLEPLALRKSAKAGKAEQGPGKASACEIPAPPGLRMRRGRAHTRFHPQGE
jgi:hypothetical protein